MDERIKIVNQKLDILKKYWNPSNPKEMRRAIARIRADMEKLK